MFLSAKTNDIYMLKETKSKGNKQMMIRLKKIYIYIIY